VQLTDDRPGITVNQFTGIIDQIELDLHTSYEANGTLNSSANLAARRGVRLRPWPPTMIGGCGD